MGQKSGVKTAEEIRQAWLIERQKGIGGSDAAAVVGLSAYVTPYALWADKTGRLPDREDNEAMRQGRELEQYVADRFMEASGKKVRRRCQILRNPAYPYAHANVDRWLVGENAGLECKTTSVLNLKKFRGGEFPVTYYCQCVHYMAVTGAKRWYLAVLVLNQGFMAYQLTRIPDDPKPDWCETNVYIEDAEIEALMAAERAFWENCVLTGTPPPLDGLPGTSEALDAIYAQVDKGAEVDLFGREKVIQEMLDLRGQIGDLERRKELLEQEIKADLGEAETGYCGPWQARWKAQSRKSFDYKRLLKEQPNMDLSGYFNESVFRRFEIKEMVK